MFNLPLIGQAVTLQLPCLSPLKEFLLPCVGHRNGPFGSIGMHTLYSTRSYLNGKVQGLFTSGPETVLHPIISIIKLVDLFRYNFT